MNINDYLEKLRAKPVQERERIAVIATGISFAIILLIWLISFSEMNKNENPEPSSSPVTNQLEDLKKNIGNDKQSIQDMLQSLPQSADQNNAPAEIPQDNGTGDQNQDENDSQSDQSEIPSLP